MENKKKKEKDSEWENKNKQIFFQVNFMCFVYQQSAKHMQQRLVKRKKEKIEINIRNGICRDTAKTVFFSIVEKKCVFESVCLYFWFSISFRCRCISLRFRCWCFFLRSFSLSCCLLFRAHVHKWLFKTLLIHSAEYVQNETNEKNYELFYVLYAYYAYCRRILGDDIYYEKTSYGSV